ncbi:MAG TPA: hypothetical protein VGR73_06435 [Bryobacteraceae bacterium]|nr:hypothetical protein [Bryobacteraceae bacterium]
MYFDTTPLNLTTLLVVALAVIAVVFLSKGRYHSNLPLLFYAAVITMATTTDRGVNTYLLYTGVGLALILRFEFMGGGFTKFIAILTSSAMCLISLSYLDQVFGNGTILT